MKKLLFYTLIITSFFACEDIFEEDLQPLKVTLVSPKNADTSATLTRLFYWEKTEGAISYTIQIASPSFLAPSQFLLDSTVTSNSYRYTFANAGTYEWRVRANNGSSETAFETRSMVITVSNDLSKQIIVLKSPIDNYITNTLAITFKWDTLPKTTNYNFVLKKNSNTGVIVSDKSVKTDSISETLGEGIYAWGIQAENTNSKSPFTYRTISVDTTRPKTPVLTFPVDTVLTDSLFTFAWNRGEANNGTNTTDSLFISKDSLFATIFKNLIPTTTDTTHTIRKDSLGVGSYFWRVLSKDAASNKSGFSVTKKFTIQ